jgi:hypothetical protein
MHFSKHLQVIFFLPLRWARDLSSRKTSAVIGLMYTYPIKIKHDEYIVAPLGKITVCFKTYGEEIFLWVIHFPFSVMLVLLILIWV